MSLSDTCNIWVVSPGPTWWQDRMCLHSVEARRMTCHPTGKLVDYKCNLCCLLSSTLVEGAPLGLSLNFKPRSPYVQLNLIFLNYGICQVDSCLTSPDDVMGTLDRTLGIMWLHNWFTIHPASPTVIAHCHSMLMLLCLKFSLIGSGSLLPVTPPNGLVVDLH